jgi:hypothetical protein
MTLRLPTIAILGAALAGSAVVIQLLPNGSANAGNDSNVAHVVSAAPQQAAVVAAAEPKASATCTQVAWPYTATPCTGSGATARNVRVISTDRDAPRAVPLPASVVTERQAAPQSAPVVAASEPRAAAPAKSSPIPAPVVASADVDATGSIEPAKAVTKPAPVRRTASRAKPRMEQEARAVRFEDNAARTTVYRYADGREVIVRSPARYQGNRQLAVNDDAAMRQADQRPGRQEGLFSWLSSSEF